MRLSEKTVGRGFAQRANDHALRRARFLAHYLPRTFHAIRKLPVLVMNFPT